VPEERLAEAVERGGDVVERARADVAAIVSQESSIRLNGSPTMAETQTGPHEAEHVSTAASVMAWRKCIARASGGSRRRERARGGLREHGGRDRREDGQTPAASYPGWSETGAH